jgi:hypothetical protein
MCILWEISKKIHCHLSLCEADPLTSGTDVCFPIVRGNAEAQVSWHASGKLSLARPSDFENEIEFSCTEVIS